MFEQWRSGLNREICPAGQQSRPDFRAPRRVLLALYANQDKLASAAEQMRALKRVEPTFEMSKFLNDPEYPNTTVRNAGLLKNKEKFDLG